MRVDDVASNICRLPALPEREALPRQRANAGNADEGTHVRSRAEGSLRRSTRTEIGRARMTLGRPARRASWVLLAVSYGMPFDAWNQGSECVG